MGKLGKLANATVGAGSLGNSTFAPTAIPVVLASFAKLKNVFSGDALHGLKTAALYCIPLLLTLMSTQLQTTIHVQAMLLLSISIFLILPPSLMAFFDKHFQQNIAGNIMRICVILAGASNGVLLSMFIR